MQRLFLAFLCLTVSGAHCALAPFIKPCKKNDNQCVKQSTVAAIPFFAPGIPELGVPPTDPIFLKTINADQGELKLSFMDLKIAGLSKCEVDDITKDYDESLFTLKMRCPVNGTGYYKLGGQLFVVPAEGDGKFEIKTDEILIDVKVNFKTITGKDGAEHWKITNFAYSYDVGKKVYFQLDNLFGGDETKAKPVREIFDNSWREVVIQFGKPIVESLVKEVVENVKKFFLAVPVNELRLP